MDKIEHQSKLYRIERIKKWIMLIPFLFFVIFVATYLIPGIKNNINKINNTNVIQKENTIGIIKINQIITQPFVNNITNSIDQALNDKKVKKIIFLLNSPGGSPSASENLMAYILKTKKIIPMYGYVNDICTSGCYYSAIALDKISSNKNAIVGSIGVLMPNLDFSKVAKKIGISDATITIGKYKKPFSPIEGITAENEKYLKKHLLSPVYENFSLDVIKHRNISGKKSHIQETFFDGKVFIANNPEIQKILIDSVIDWTSFKDSLLNGKLDNSNTQFIEIQLEENNSFFKSLLESVSNLKLFSSNPILL